MIWSMGRLRGAVRLGFVAAMLTIATIEGLAAQTVELVSRVDPGQLSDTGAHTDRISGNPYDIDLIDAPSFSADGRFVVFLGAATNLVAGQKDRNHWTDVFLQDLVTGTMTLVSRSMSSPATAGNFASTSAVISADGRFVAFVSFATDLVPGQGGDETSSPDLLLYDRVTGTVSPVASSDATSAVFDSLAISADGRYISFSGRVTDLLPGAQGDGNVFLFDRVEKAVRLVSHRSGSATAEGNRPSYKSSMSADGRFVAFISSATDLAPGSGGDSSQAFLFDRTSGATARIGPGESAVLSADGRQVAVVAPGSLFLYERETRQATPLGAPRQRPHLSTSRPPLALSADGRFVAFLGAPEPSPKNGLYVYDRIARTFTNVADGSADAPVISADGRFVVFATPRQDLIPGQVDANDSMDVFVFDRTSGTTRLVSHRADAAAVTGNSFSYAHTISADGSRVSFASMAGDLAGGLRDFNQGQDFFVQATASGITAALSAHAPGAPSLSDAFASTARAFSADGRWLAFTSDSVHLIPGQVDRNGTTDIFLYDRTTHATILVSRSSGSALQAADGRSASPVITPDGRYVGFVSEATDLAPGADGSGYDLFLFDRITGATTLASRASFSNFGTSEPVMWISPDGRWVAFVSGTASLIPGIQDVDFGAPNVFLLDRSTGTTTLVSHASADPLATGVYTSFHPQVSDDGRYVAFLGDANHLVAGMVDQNGYTELFLHDRATDKTVLVSHTPDSALAAAGVGERDFSMSADGRFVVFTGRTGEPSPSVLLYDRTLGTNQTIASGSLSPRISADGRYVTFASFLKLPGTEQTRPQIYLYDRVAKSIRLVSRSPVSRYVGTGPSDDPVISSDGRYVAFSSFSLDQIPGLIPAPGRSGADLFLFDRIAGTTALVSHSGDSLATAMGSSRDPLVSDDGRVAFTSSANLVTGDYNELSDAYLVSLAPASPGGPNPLPACSLLDTRRRAERPVLTSNVRRDLQVRGRCGVPATAKQVVVKVTVFQPSGKGNLRFYPGAVTAAHSGIMRFERAQTRTESFTLPVGTDGKISILPFMAGKGTVHAAVEVTGYSQ